MKKILIGALAVLMCMTVFSCSSAPVYSDGVAVEQITQVALDAVDSAKEYMDGTANYYSYYFEGKQGAEHISECRMMFHEQETNVNELGVFHVDSKKAADEVKALVQSYLDEQTEYLRSFAQNYSPADVQKIDNADVTVMGCYVVHYILSPEHEAKALDAVKALLTAE